jgi:4-amino-4-deoxy-L-arabinose transferase-like glycosyltransferase
MSEPRALRWLLARPLLALCLLGGLLCAVGLGNELWTPDEPRVAEIGRAMWHSGSWALPRLGGEPFLEKPPFYWWIQSAVFELFGRADARVARTASALLAFGTLLLTYGLGRRYFAREACLLSGLVLLSMTDYALASHWVVVDNALVLGVTGAFACFAHAEGRRDRWRAPLLAGMYGFIAIAFFSKGVIGLGMPVLGIFVYLLGSGRLRAFLGWHLLLGSCAIGALVALWLHAIWLEGGRPALEAFLIDNQLGRFLPGGTTVQWGHRRPFWYYALNAPGDWLPWTPFIALAGVSARRNWRRFDTRQREGLRLCLAASASILVALSVSATKRSIYLLPIYPTVALLVGAWMVGEVERAAWERRLERLTSSLLLFAAAASPLLAAGAAVALLRLDAPPWSFWGVALLAVGWAAVRIPRPRQRTAQLASVAVIVCLATGNLLATLKPALDPHKSFVPFVRELERWIPAQRPLYVFHPPEATLGVIGFYTQRAVTPVELDAIRRLAQGREPSWVVVRDRSEVGGLYGMILAEEIPHRLVSESVVDATRHFRILALGAAAAEGAPEEEEG